MDTLSVITVILAGATVWLGFATRQMANISAKEFDLETRPYFAFKNFDFLPLFNQQSGKIDLRVGLIFSNPGKVLIQYKEKSLHVQFREKTTEDTEHDNHGGERYPQAENTFLCGIIRGIDMAAVPGKGRLEYEFEYFAVPEQKSVVKKTINYTIYSFEPFRF